MECILTWGYGGYEWYWQEMGIAFHENYSDMVKGMYIINAPWLFHKVRKMSDYHQQNIYVK